MENCDLCGLKSSFIQRLKAKGVEYKVCSTCCCDFHETMAFLEHGQFVLARNREPSRSTSNTVPSGESNNLIRR